MAGDPMQVGSRGLRKLGRRNGIRIRARADEQPHDLRAAGKVAEPSITAAAIWCVTWGDDILLGVVPDSRAPGGALGRGALATRGTRTAI